MFSNKARFLYPATTTASAAAEDVKKRSSSLKTEDLLKFILEEAAAVYFGLIGFAAIYSKKKSNFLFPFWGWSL